MKKSGIGKFIAGAAVGAGLGILFAPKTGKETRAVLKKCFHTEITFLHRKMYYIP